MYVCLTASFTYLPLMYYPIFRPSALKCVFRIVIYYIELNVVRIPIYTFTSLPSPLLYPCFYFFSFAHRPKACSCVHFTGAASDKKRCSCYCGRLEESAQIGAGRTHGKYNIGRFYIIYSTNGRPIQSYISTETHNTYTYFIVTYYI